MRKWYLMIGAWLLVISGQACNNEGDKPAKPASPPAANDSSHSAATAPKEADQKDMPYPVDNISGFAGVVQISDTAHYSDGFDFVLYNKDLTVWKKLRFSEGMTDSAGLMPYLFNYDHNLMIFRCLEKKGDYYRVIVNEKKGLEKLISVHEGFLMFQTWPQHLQSVYAVEFDAKKNPLRKNADSLAAQLSYDKEQAYMPEKVEGDWLRVKWGDENNLKRGWIKWKDAAGNLLVNIFYEE